MSSSPPQATTIFRSSRIAMSFVQNVSTEKVSRISWNLPVTHIFGWFMTSPWSIKGIYAFSYSNQPPSNWMPVVPLLATHKHFLIEMRRIRIVCVLNWNGCICFPWCRSKSVWVISPLLYNGHTSVCSPSAIASKKSCHANVPFSFFGGFGLGVW